MSSLLRLTVLAGIVLFAAPWSVKAQIFPPPEGELKSEYDRFTDQRQIRLYNLLVGEQTGDLRFVKLYVSLGTDYSSGRTPQAPKYVALVFSAWTLLEYRFAKPEPLYALVDGQRKSYGYFETAGNQIINGKYVSSVVGRVTYEDFKEIVKAKKVEMRIGNIEFGLTEGTHNKIREFATMITP